MSGTLKMSSRLAVSEYRTRTVGECTLWYTPLLSVPETKSLEV